MPLIITVLAILAASTKA